MVYVACQQEILQAGQMESVIWNDGFWQRLKKLVQDPIVDVRIRTARLLSLISGMSNLSVYLFINQSNRSILFVGCRITGGIAGTFPIPNLRDDPKTISRSLKRSQSFHPSHPFWCPTSKYGFRKTGIFESVEEYIEFFKTSSCFFLPPLKKKKTKKKKKKGGEFCFFFFFLWGFFPPPPPLFFFPPPPCHKLPMLSSHRQLQLWLAVWFNSGWSWGLVVSR